VHGDVLFGASRESYQNCKLFCERGIPCIFFQHIQLVLNDFQLVLYCNRSSYVLCMESGL
jgi:hypothetical protein